MRVKLISTTKPHIQGVNTAEELIVYTARVSNPSNQMNMETAPRLINYLIKNKHWSPFEMAHMTVEIQTSRAIAAQILRHRSFSFQEFSQRYAEVTEFENVGIRKQGITNRQSSSEDFDPIIQVYGITAKASAHIADLLYDVDNLYNMLLNAGVAREVARMILPLTTQTTIYMSGSVRSWIHYLQIRTDEHTQLEHRQVAEAVQEIFNREFPNIAEALKSNE